MTNICTAPTGVNCKPTREARNCATVTLTGQTFDLGPGRTLPHEAVGRLRHVIRTWVLPALAPVDQAIVSALATLIPYMGRMQRRITHRMLLEGYFSEKDDRWITHPVGVSEKTLRRHLAMLEETGLIGRTRDGNGQAHTYHFNFALLVAPRSVAALHHAIREKAKAVGSRISGSAMMRLARTLAAGCGSIPEIVAQIHQAFSPQTPVILTPHKAFLTPSLTDVREGESRADHQQNEDQDMNMLRSSRHERAQPAPTPAAGGPLGNGSATPPPVSWLSRVPRVRLAVEDTEENRAVLEAGATLADEDAGISLAEVLQASMGEVQHRAEQRITSRTSGAMALQALWADEVKTVTGRNPTGWTMQEREHLRQTMRRVPLPDPQMTWASVLSWIVRQWGLANGLARPAAFRHEDNVERIIKAEPRIYHVIKHAEEYVRVYAEMFHGAGVAPANWNRAQHSLQPAYEAYCARAAMQVHIGSDQLPARHLSNAELEHKTLLSDDDRAREARAQRERYRQEYRAARRADPRVTAEQFEREKAAHRVREGWERNEQDPAFADILRGHEGQFDEGYFED